MKVESRPNIIPTKLSNFVHFKNLNLDPYVLPIIKASVSVNSYISYSMLEWVSGDLNVTNLVE